MRSFVTITIFVALVSTGCGAESAPPNNDDQKTKTGAGSLAWPTEWASDITWSSFASDGTKTNVWTGKVWYNWGLRAMRTDVVPPTQGAEPGPPIAEEGTMLMRDGDIYFITKSGSCEHAARFGAPQPDWVSVSQGAPMDPSRSRASEETWVVDLARLDNELEGCFFYSIDQETELPRLFGGGPCSDWPKGSFIEYSNLRQEEIPDDMFAVPMSCAGAEPPDPESSKACWTCHDHN